METTAGSGDDIPLGEELDDGFDEDDGREFGIVQCLPVSDAEPNLDSEQPLTVEEYLRRVRFEARHLPQVVRCDVTPTTTVPGEEEEGEEEEQQKGGAVRNEIDLAVCGEDRKPSVIWVRRFLGYFVSMRRVLREYGDAASVDLYEFERLGPCGQVALQGLLEREVDALERMNDVGVGACEVTFKRLYTILALVYVPCHSDTLACIRKLTRLCTTARAQDPRPNDDELSLLNLVIVICGGLFRQDEELARVWDEELNLRGTMMKGANRLVLLLLSVSVHSMLWSGAICATTDPLDVFDAIGDDLSLITQNVVSGVQEKRENMVNTLEETRNRFRDAAGNVYDVITDASGAATNFVRDKAGTIYDVTQMAGEFLYDSVRDYPGQLRDSAMDLYNEFRETAVDTADAMRTIGDAARDAIPRLPDVTEMHKPMAWARTFALNNLYLEDFTGTVDDQITSLEEGIAAKYCKENKYRPSSKVNGELVFPGGFRLELATKKCEVHSHEDPNKKIKVKCHHPKITFEKFKGVYTSKHHTAPEFTSKECKYTKSHGNPDEIVLWEFDGHGDFDAASTMKSLQDSLVAAFDGENIESDINQFVEEMPEIEDVEADFLDLITSGLPDVKMT